MTNHAREANVICSIDHHLIKTKNVISVHVISMYIYIATSLATKYLEKENRLNFLRRQRIGIGTEVHHGSNIYIIEDELDSLSIIKVHIPNTTYIFALSVCLPIFLVLCLPLYRCFYRCKRHICSIAYT